MTILQTLKAKAKRLKTESVALYYAYQDRRTPRYAKLMIAFTLAYLFSPIDVIPDFIPVLGYVDDLIIIPLCIALSIKLIPQGVMEQARLKAVQAGGIGKKTSWAFAAIVIILWLLVAYMLIRLFFPNVQTLWQA